MEEILPISNANMNEPSATTPSDKPLEPALLAEGGAVRIKPVSKWAIPRRVYDWTLSLAHSKHGTTSLFCLSFAESSFFPIPPDVLQIALTLEKRTRAFFYAFISTLGSVLGGMLGYLIGFALWHAVSGFFFSYIIKEEIFLKVQTLYQDYDFWCVFIAAFTPIPYKVFTIAGGVFEISFVMFVIGSTIGRAGRFFLVGALLYKFGPPIKTFIEKYFNILSLVFVVLLVGAFALLKLLH